MYNNLMEEINNLIADKNFKQAELELEKILETDEKNLDALKLLGLCYVNLQKFDKG